jgi:predicted alpha/beta hydrolase family esterase
MRRVIGINGIHTYGEGNIDPLLEMLEERGLPVVDVRLPKRNALDARWGGCIDAMEILRVSNDGDVAVAHSFGCVRAWYAQQHRMFSAIICIAPAMDPKAMWRRPEAVTCLYSPKDYAVRLGAMLMFHPFGPAGVKGFTQHRVQNIRYDCGHNGYFEGERLSEVADLVEGRARR